MQYRKHCASSEILRYAQDDMGVAAQEDKRVALRMTVKVAGDDPHPVILRALARRISSRSPAEADR